MNIFKAIYSGIFLILSVIAVTAAAGQEIESGADTADGGTSSLVVYHDPNCGCCGRWVAQMKAHGFTVVNVTESNMSSRKHALDVPTNLWSCHTAVIDGYVIEGHVPAADVERLLEERPEGKGLAVPGMPLGSPGMEQGSRRQAYDVLLFGGPDGPKVFNHYSARP